MIMADSTRTTSCTFLISSFQLTWDGVITLYCLVGLQLGKMFHCDNFSSQNHSCTFKNYHSSVHKTASMGNRLYISKFSTKSKGIGPNMTFLCLSYKYCHDSFFSNEPFSFVPRLKDFNCTPRLLAMPHRFAFELTRYIP